VSERSERILIVDDEAGIRSTLSGILEDEGYGVAAVGTAAEATARLGAEAFDAVLLDPPRSGAPALLAALARLAPRRVLYISCHPGSLARDLGVLVHEHGFKLAAAGVVDMFPHTAHVESLALLTADPRDAALPAP